MATGAGEEGRKKLTIAFIGAKGVGKTSIITQFVHNHFNEAVASTSSPHRYSTTVVTNNNRIIEFHISDFPVLSKFPEDSLQEWNLQCCQRSKHQQHPVHVGSSSTSNAAGTTTGTCIPPQSFCRLRQVSAYVLVFDASRPTVTFQYIRQIREQILRNGGNEAYKRPIVVAVNKQDLVVQHQRPAIVGSSGSRSHHRLTGGNQSSNTKNNAAWPTNEWSCLVRKQWRCLYVETSAKFNWQVVHLFQQVLSAVENCNSSGGTGRHPGSGEHSRLQHQIIQLPHILHLASLNAVVPIPPLAQTMGPPPPPPLPPGTRNTHSTSPTRIRSRALRQCPVS